MKTPWNLIIPDKKIQANLNEKLIKTLRPFFCTSIVICLFVLFTLSLNNYIIVKKEWTEYLDFFVNITCILMVIGGFLTLLKPGHSTKIVLIIRILVCILMCYSMQIKFSKIAN